jgi:biotin/methionine sulfoxide reductase
MPQAPTRSRVHTGSHWGVYQADMQDGRLAAVIPHPQDLYPAPLLEGVPSAVYHESRIQQPMVRQGYLEHGLASNRAGRGVEPFVPMSWDQALDLIAGELGRVKQMHGNEAIFASSGWASAGTFHHAGSQLFRFLNSLGGYVSSVTNWSFGAASVILPHIVGSMEPLTRLTAWPTLRDHTKLLVMFGGMAPKNLQVQNGGLVQHRTLDWLRQLHQAGVECVNISPMRSDAADLLDAEWLAVRPNTDTALMLGLAHTLLVEGRHDEAFLARYCVGFERFRAYLLGHSDGQPKDAPWAAAITDIPAERIQRLARRMAAVRTMLTVSWSLQRADHGEQPYWAAMTLAAMLGQIGLPGGGVGFGYGATGGNGNAAARMPQPKLPTGSNSVKAFMPVARFADMLLNPGASYDFNGQRLTYPDIRLVYWCGGSPFHKVQDLNKLLRAWQRPETIIIHEPWWTPSARRADIVLPCTTTLERNDIGVSLFDGCYFAMQQAIAPVGEARSDYAIYSALAARLGCAERFTEGRSEMEWLHHLYAEARQQAAQQQLTLPPFEAFWEAGTVEVPRPEHPPVLFAAFRQAPDAHPLPTPSGRIEIFSETIDRFGYDDCPGHATWLEPAEWLGSPQTAQYPLHLLSNQPRARLHSQLDCSTVSLQAKVADREALWLHPEDAAARGIHDGDVVCVYNARGSCLAGAVVTTALRPGVVQLATGAWFDPADPATVGSLDKHGNPNVLTLDKGTSKLGQCSSAQTTLVEVVRLTEPPPPLTAFTPPAMHGPSGA